MNNDSFLFGEDGKINDSFYKENGKWNVINAIIVANL